MASAQRDVLAAFGLLAGEAAAGEAGARDKLVEIVEALLFAVTQSPTPRATEAYSQITRATEAYSQITLVPTLMATKASSQRRTGTAPHASVDRRLSLGAAAAARPGTWGEFILAEFHIDKRTAPAAWAAARQRTRRALKLFRTSQESDVRGAAGQGQRGTDGTRCGRVDAKARRHAMSVRGGRPIKCPELAMELFSWYVDRAETLQARVHTEDLRAQGQTLLQKASSWMAQQAADNHWTPEAPPVSVS